MSIHDRIWLITQEGLYQAIDTKRKIAQTSSAELNQIETNLRAQSMVEEPEFEQDYMMERFGPLAVISIRGTLVNDDHPFNRFFGEVGYPEIRRAVMEAVEHEDVKAILLDMDTPGGQVSGISETVDFLKNVDQNHVPIYAHASSSMASGGYWLGSVGRRITTSELAVVGSIGVVTVHADYSKMYKNQGIEINVLRQGEFKALGNPYERLDEKAKNKIMDEMEVIYDTFLGQVADSRGMSVLGLKETAAEGRVFYGNEAVAVGLADEVSSFDAVAARLIAEYSPGNVTVTVNTVNSETGVDMKGKKRVLSEAGVAAIAAGASEEQVLADEELTTTVSEESEQKGGDTTAAEEEQNTEASEEETTEANAEESSEEASEESSESTEANESSESEAEASDAGAGQAIGELMKQISALNEELAETKVALKTATQKVTAMGEHEEKLVKIAAAATNRMQIALGGTATKLEGLDAGVVVDTYFQTLSEFNGKFKVGSVAEVPGESDTASVADEAGQDPVASSAQSLTKFGRK